MKNTNGLFSLTKSAFFVFSLMFSANSLFAEENHFFIGGGARFGQAYATENGSPGSTYTLFVEPGFSFARDSWAKIDLSLELFHSKLDMQVGDSTSGKADVTYDIPYGALIKAAYGFSMGEGMWSFASIGLGSAAHNTTIKNGGSSATSVNTESGFVSHLGWNLMGKLSENVSLGGGLLARHYSFSIGKVKSNGVEYNVDTKPQANQYQAEILLRVML